jgi:hypothetical protein
LEFFASQSLPVGGGAVLIIVIVNFGIPADRLEGALIS